MSAQMKESFQWLVYILFHCMVLIMGSVGIGILSWTLVMACTAITWLATAAGVIAFLFVLFVPLSVFRLEGGR